MRRLLIWSAAIVVAWALFARWALPSLVEPRFDRVVSKPPYQILVDAQHLHRTVIIADLHADSLLWNRDLLERSERGQLDLPRLQQAGVTLQTFSIVTRIPRGLNINRNSDDSDLITRLAMAELWPPRTWTSLSARALYQAGRLERMARNSNGSLSIIRTRSDLEKHLAARTAGSTAVAAVLSLEGAHALEGDLHNLDRLFDAGVRIVGLAHFTDNTFAGSSSGLSQGGLSAQGRELVSRAEAKHMLIDLAHASPATIRDVTAMAARPVIVSHTGIKATCSNNRNLDDASIRAVARTGGVIGIGFWNTAVCGNDAVAIARAIKKAVEIAGAEHVALGSDFDGATTTPFDVTGLPLLTEALLKEGLTEKEIRLVMGENVMRVLLQSLPE